MGIDPAIIDSIIAVKDDILALLGGMTATGLTLWAANLIARRFYFHMMVRRDD